MARAQAQLESVLMDDKLTDEDKLLLLEQAQQKFKNLKATVGPIDAVQPVTVALPAAAMAAPAPAPGPAVDDIERDLDPALHKDYQTLKALIDKNPQLIRANRNGLLVHKDRTVPGTSFKDIIIAVLTGQNLSSTAGLDKFVKGVQGMHPTKKSFTSPLLAKNLFTPYSPPAPSPFAVHSPSVSVQSTPPPTESTRSKRLSKRISFQTGKGHTRPPPGKRPRILFLYH